MFWLLLFQILIYIVDKLLKNAILNFLPASLFYLYSQMLGCKETKLTLHVFYETKIETIMFGLSFLGVLKLM